jgi:hypothetical protein
MCEIVYYHIYLSIKLEINRLPTKSFFQILCILLHSNPVQCMIVCIKTQCRNHFNFTHKQKVAKQTKKKRKKKKKKRIYTYSFTIIPSIWKQVTARNKLYLSLKKVKLCYSRTCINKCTNIYQTDETFLVLSHLLLSCVTQ